MVAAMILHLSIHLPMKMGEKSHLELVLDFMHRYLDFEIDTEGKLECLGSGNSSSVLIVFFFWMGCVIV